MGKKTDKVLGSISPLYGAISGRGLFGDMTQLGLAAQLSDAAGIRADDKKKPVKKAKGGKVKSRRGDGLAKRGRTKGKMR